MTPFAVEDMASWRRGAAAVPRLKALAVPWGGPTLTFLIKARPPPVAVI